MAATCCNSAGTRMLMGATGYLILWLSSVSSSLSNRYLGGLDPMSALEYFYVTVTQGTSDDGIRLVSCFVPRPSRMDVHHMFRVMQDTCTYLPMYLCCQGMYFPFQHLTATQSWGLFPIPIPRLPRAESASGNGQELALDVGLGFHYFGRPSLVTVAGRMLPSDNRRERNKRKFLR